ncbi:unnamed protein product [Calypogeia fissa]
MMATANLRLGSGCSSSLETQGRAATALNRDGGSSNSMVHCASLGSSKSALRGAAIRSTTALPQLPPRPLVQRQMVFAQQDLAQQIKEMAAAEKRWESQIRDGKVKSLSPKEAGYAVDLSGYTLLDVRPTSERNKAYVKSSTWVPIFENNKNLDPGTLLNKFSNFTMGGWWSGSPLMDYNGRFMPDVVSKIPKSANVVVACQTGLRSLAACEQLYKAGYRNLYWLNGGFDAAEEGDLQREGTTSFKFAGLGGVSEFLGWTDVQREAAKKEGWGFRAMLFGRLMAVVLGVDLLFVGGQQLAQFIQGLRQ